RTSAKATPYAAHPPPRSCGLQCRTPVRPNDTYSPKDLAMFHAWLGKLWQSVHGRPARRSRASAPHGPRRPHLEQLEARWLLTTYTVVNTNDSGAGSLRQAILDANADGNLIQFNIPGAGVHTIAPTSALPPVSHAVALNGYSQPGASVNTLAVGSNAVLLIEI